MTLEDWHREAAYGQLFALSLADLAFECLRRNSSYRADYQRGRSQSGDAAKVRILHRTLRVSNFP